MFSKRNLTVCMSAVFTSCLMIILTLFFLPLTALADEIVPYDVYYQTLHEAYAKQGIDFQITHHDENTIYTSDDLMKELESVPDITPCDQSELSDPEPLEQAESPLTPWSLMPYDKTFTSWTYVTPHANMGAYIYLAVTATIDGQYGNVLGIKSCYTYQEGGALNFKSWTQTSAKAVRSSNTTISATATGYALFERRIKDEVYSYNMPVTLSDSWTI